MPFSPKLQSLLDASVAFNSLSAEEKSAHLEKISQLSAENQEKVCQFFEEENANRTESDKEKLLILSQLYSQVVDLEQKFSKLLKKDPELKDHEHDKDKLETLLNSLN